MVWAGVLASVSLTIILAGSTSAARATPSRAASASDVLSSALLGGSSLAGSTRTPIQHVVIIQKENRSFDQYFGRFPGADGATQGTMHDGTVVPLGQTPDPIPNDVAHSEASFRVAYDKGAMDGFDLEKGAFSTTGQNLAYS